MSETIIHHPHHPALHHDPQAARNAIAAMEEAELRELKARQRWQSRAFVFGRFLLGGMFVVGAVFKTVSFEATRAALADFGLEAAGLILTLAIAIEGVCGALIIVGYKA